MRQDQGIIFYSGFDKMKNQLKPQETILFLLCRIEILHANLLFDNRERPANI